MVKVFLTVDTEVWPRAEGWPHKPLAASRDCAREIELYFYGGDPPAGMGLPFQLATLARHGLRATYFVDPLFSFALGLSPLRDVVTTIHAAGQEVALHLHPEWLTDPRCQGMPRFAGPLLRDYAIADQVALLRAGIARLGEAGAHNVRAFRAGSWGASRATVEALDEVSIPFDSSLSPTFYPASFPDIDRASRAAFTQPFRIGNTWEFPVTTFVDRPPAGLRPMNVCAASFAEMRAVLEHARVHRWYALVLVLHSFEFVRLGRRSAGSEPAPPQRLLADRFERLCRYLADNHEAFETCHFASLDPAAIPTLDDRAVPVSSTIRTTLRRIEQLASRVY